MPDVRTETQIRRDRTNVAGTSRREALTAISYAFDSITNLSQCQVNPSEVSDRLRAVEYDIDYSNSTQVANLLRALSTETRRLDNAARAAEEIIATCQETSAYVAKVRETVSSLRDALDELPIIERGNLVRLRDEASPRANYFVLGVIGEQWAVIEPYDGSDTPPTTVALDDLVRL